MKDAVLTRRDNSKTFNHAGGIFSSVLAVLCIAFRNNKKGYNLSAVIFDYTHIIAALHK